MDLPELVVTAAVSLVSAATGVTVAAWKLGRQIEEIKATAHAAQTKAEKLETELDRFIKENHQSWENLNFNLGQIMGAMGLRPKQNSQP